MALRYVFYLLFISASVASEIYTTSAPCTEEPISTARKPIITPEQYKKLTFAIDKVIQPIIAILGVIGNGLSLAVFSRQKTHMASSIRIYLTALCIIDLIFLTTSLYESVLDYVGETYAEEISMVQAYGKKYVMPIVKGARGSSSFMVVVISLERFIAISSPLSSGHNCFKRFPFLPITIVVLLNVIFSIFIILSFNPVQTETLLWRAVATEFATNNNFLKTYGIVAEVLYQLIPMMLVTTFNVATVVQLSIAKKRRNRLSKHRSNSSNEAQASRMLAGVALLFNICVLPSFIIGFITLVHPTWRNTSHEKDLLKSATKIAKLLSRFNSSANIFVYVLTSKKFCEALFDIILPNRRHQGTTTTPMTNLTVIGGSIALDNNEQGVKCT